MFVFIVGGWLALSIIVAVCAVKKGLNGIDYFLVSLFLSPLLGTALVLLKIRKARCPTQEKENL